MQLFALPAHWGLPDDVHYAAGEDANQEEVYIPLEGSAELWAGDERFGLRPGMMLRVGPEQRRRIVPGQHGIRFIALGGVVPAVRTKRSPRPSRVGSRSCNGPGDRATHAA